MFTILIVRTGLYSRHTPICHFGSVAARGASSRSTLAGRLPMTTPTAPTFRTLWLPDLKQQAPMRTDWVWQGYLAAGNVTLLSSQWKMGKTTLLSILFDRLKAGGKLLGLPVKPGKAVIVSEEEETIWEERSLRFDFAGQLCWICRPFTVPPSMADWLALLDHLLDLR